MTDIWKKKQQGFSENKISGGPCFPVSAGGEPNGYAGREAKVLLPVWRLAQHGGSPGLQIRLGRRGFLGLSGAHRA